jgi:hypothetical protein
VIEFPEWLPDLPDFEGGMTEAKNVLPAERGYRSFGSLVSFSNALDSACIGAFSAIDAAGNVYNYAGDAAKLYERSSNSYTDVSVVGGYNTADGEWWEFVRWNDDIFATNYSDPIQEITMGGANFANLGGSPPQARHIAVVGDFVVVGNTVDGTFGTVPNKVRWCAIGDPTDWTIDPLTQADYQDLKGSGGQVQKVIGGEYGVIFQERSIQRMTYVGSPVIFQFDEVEQNHGTPAPQSVVAHRDMIYYLGQDGFYVFDGARSRPIGKNKVDKSFFAEVNQSNLHKITGVVDPINSIVMWGYPTGSNTTNNKIIAYNWSTQRWSYGEIENQFLVWHIPDGYTLDELDPFGTLETLPFSLDSRQWVGSGISLSAFDSTNKQGVFTGSDNDAVLETAEFEAAPGMFSTVKGVRPIVESGDSVSVRVGYRNRSADTVTYTASQSINAIGNADVRVGARYHRAEVTITPPFSNALGVDIDASQQGKR